MLALVKRNKQEIVVCLIFIFFALAFNVYRVESDGRVYYKFLEYMLRLPNPESFPAGYYKTSFQQSGCAFFNAPFYLVAYFIEKLFRNSLNLNGITLRQISINLASNFYMVISLILAVRILKKLNFKYKILPVVSVLFSTSAFSIAVVMSSFNHAVDIFVNTVFIYLFFKYRNNNPQKNFWLGIFYVLTILIRYFNCFLAIPLIVYYLNLKEYQRIKYFFLGSISIVWILPIIFYIYNDNALSPTFTSGGLKIFFLGLPLFPKYFFKSLIHPLHGLFIWSPVVILSTLGLLVMPKAKEKIGYLFFGMFFLFLTGYGYTFRWYGGWSFSNRYLVNLFPIYIIGLSAFLEKYGKKMVLLVIVFTLYSSILYLNWRLNIINGEFGTPWNMIQAWIKGEAESSYDKKLDFGIFFHRLYETCRYKYFFRFLK